MSEGMSWSATNISGLWTSQADLLGSVAGHLEPRDVMDYLFQEHALSEDDMELIKAEVTRKRRCKSLIKQLLLRENNIQALYTFVESLRFDYDFLTADVSKQVRSYLEPTNVSSSVMIHPFGKHCHRAGRRSSSRRSFCSQPSLVPCQSQHTRGKHVLKMYNSLSGVLNRGEIDTFESRVRLYLDSDISADVKCIVMYLNACKASFQNDFKEALHMYKNAMMLVPKTEHPVVFEVEMLSVKAWICVKHGKLNKLEGIVSSAWQKIISEPRCSGKVAGWICIDYAHLLVALLESANLERAKPLRKRALECLEMASYHFLTDNCKDGPFGFNFALIKYATVLLRCGNRMSSQTLLFHSRTFPMQRPSSEEWKSVKMAYLIFCECFTIWQEPT